MCNFSSQRVNVLYGSGLNHLYTLHLHFVTYFSGSGANTHCAVCAGMEIQRSVSAAALDAVFFKWQIREIKGKQLERR